MAERDPRTDPARGDVIETRGTNVLIEDTENGTVGYRYLKSDESWSRKLLTTLEAYRMWPISTVVRQAEEE